MVGKVIHLIIDANGLRTTLDTFNDGEFILIPFNNPMYSTALTLLMASLANKKSILLTAENPNGKKLGTLTSAMFPH